MATVISNDKLTNHSVDKYSFKVFAMGANQDKSILVPQEDIDVEIEKTPENVEIDSSAMSNSSKESLIESLMKKTDEMSSNFIKLQMKLEDMSQEHKEELIKVKEETLQKGIELGKKQFKDAQKDDIKSEFAQLSSSVLSLNDSAGSYAKLLESIKSELINAALDIAKEVVEVELNENSTKVAQMLSNELIEDLKGAAKVTLKVNPKNHGELSQSVGSLENVEIISDSAISEGGVIAISDVGNIDAQISKRFQRVKKAALSE